MRSAPELPVSAETTSGPPQSCSWHPSTAPTSTVFDTLGTGELKEINMDTLKLRFFGLGLRAGIAIQMLLMCVLLMLSANDAVYELCSLYYPIFRGCFLVSLFGVLFALLLFAWKRTGIDYGAILGVKPHRTNYHAVVRAASNLMSLNTLAFVVSWLALTVQARGTAFKHVGPLVAFAGTVLYLAAPVDWMPEWDDAAQRAELARTAGRALLAPFAAPSFAASFVADIFTSMPKCFIDLLYSACIYTSGEAFSVGRWHEGVNTFDRPLKVCTSDNPAYHRLFILLSILPFVMRLMQCVRQIHDALVAGGYGWRQPFANALKYTTSLLVIALSMSGGRSDAWLVASICSTLLAFSWDVFIDWGLGPQPLRRALRRLLTPDAPSGSAYDEAASYWLRPVRVFSEGVYVGGIMCDLIARLGWAVYISPGQEVVAQNMTLLLGTVELLRRAMWALFRLEWEQIRLVATREHEASFKRSMRAPLLVTEQRPSKEARIEAALESNKRRMARVSLENLNLWVKPES